MAKRETLQQLHQQDLRQKKLIRLLKSQEKHDRWIKYAIAAALALILLLVLLLGYATDWTAGLRKEKVRPLSTSLDAIGTGATEAAGATESGGSGGTNGGAAAGGTSSAGNTSTTTSRQTGNSGQANQSTIERITTTNATTRENNTTATHTTNNNTTTQSSATDSLTDFYNNVKAGDNINDLQHQADQSGIGYTCTDEILVKSCDFSAGGSTVSTKSLTGTGLVTSVTNNF